MFGKSPNEEDNTNEQNISSVSDSSFGAVSDLDEAYKAPGACRQWTDKPHQLIERIREHLGKPLSSREVVAAAMEHCRASWLFKHWDDINKCWRNRTFNGKEKRTGYIIDNIAKGVPEDRKVRQKLYAMTIEQDSRLARHFKKKFGLDETFVAKARALIKPLQQQRKEELAEKQRFKQKQEEEEKYRPDPAVLYFQWRPQGSVPTKNLSNGVIQAKLSSLFAGQKFNLDQGMQTNDIFCENCEDLAPLEASAPIVAAKLRQKTKAAKRHYLKLNGRRNWDKPESTPLTMKKSHLAFKQKQNKRSGPWVDKTHEVIEAINEHIGKPISSRVVVDAALQH